MAAGKQELGRARARHGAGDASALAKMDPRRLDAVRRRALARATLRDGKCLPGSVLSPFLRSLRSPSFRSDSAQRFSEQAFDGRSAELCVAAQLGEHRLHLAFAKAELAQGGEDLGVRVDEPWRHRVPVSGAVSMAEDQSSVVLPRDEQLAAMDGSAMSSAQGQKVFGLVATAFCARLDVMHVDERRVRAARGAATVLVAGEHGPAQGRWGALLGAGAGAGGCAGSARPRGRALTSDASCTFVAASVGMPPRLSASASGVAFSLPPAARRPAAGATEVLRVAGGHLDDRRVDGTSSPAAGGRLRHRQCRR